MDCVVIPKSLRSEALAKLYFSYLGSAKTICRERTLVFWPGLNAYIKELTSNCQECARHSSQQYTAILHNDLVTT